jgi:hypothetical protein
MPEFFENPTMLPNPAVFLPGVRRQARRRRVRTAVLSASSAVVVLTAAGVGLALAATGVGDASRDRVQVAGSPTGPVGSGSAGSGADIAVTRQLQRQVRASFYAAYLADPHAAIDFGVRTATANDVTQPDITHAGVVYAAQRSQDTYWVVASICFHQYLIGCQDAGGFQVFTGIGDGARLRYLGFAPCRIPSALADRWYPHQQYPMGASCPAAR